VEDLVRTYISIRVFSAPAAIAIYGITGWLIAQERTGAVLVLQLVQNGLNIALSVSGARSRPRCPRRGLGPLSRRNGRGWRWASGFAVARSTCRRGATGRGSSTRRSSWRMAAVNVDILIRSLLLMAGFTSFLFFAADFGDVTLAANQVLIQFVYFTAYAMDGFAFAAEALVGHAMGARARARLRRAAVLTSVWGIGSSAGRCRSCSCSPGACSST
jgi:MATE family multidrug resistance protein